MANAAVAAIEVGGKSIRNVNISLTGPILLSLNMGFDPEVNTEAGLENTFVLNLCLIPSARTIAS